MLQRKSVAIALIMVLGLAVVTPSFASPAGSERASIIDSVLAWFGQIGEYLGGVLEPGGTIQASTDELGAAYEPGGLSAPTEEDDSSRTFSFGEEDPPPADELGPFGEPGG